MATIRFTEGSSLPPTFAGAPGQLLPNVVDGLAHSRPEAIYAMIPNSFTSYDDGYRKITYRQLANAVNGAAQFLIDQLGPVAKPEVLAYVGPNDLGYVVFILGAVKAGYKLLLLSPRNTQADYTSLFEMTECKVVLTLPPPYTSTIHNIIKAVGLETRIVPVPTLFQLLDTTYTHVPYPKTFEGSKDEILVLVHTSGTTGTPKLVHYTHRFVDSFTRWESAVAPEGFENVGPQFQSQCVLTTFPLFHAGGIIITLLQAVMNETTLVTCLAAVPPSAQGIADALKHVRVDVVFMVAPFVEQMAKSPEMLNSVLSTVTAVGYGGADVSEGAANEFISRKIKFAAFHGSTECCVYPLVRSETWTSADMRYIQPHPVANIQFRPTDMADFCEAVIVRNDDPERTQPVFHLWPHLREYHTKDLYSPHPEKTGLWLYRGRSDDMIVSAAGEMCNPVPFEQGLSKLPQVVDAIMIGTGRYQKALLVEPTDPAPASREAYLDSIWPTIEECNQAYPKVCHIVRDHVMLTEPDTSLKRAGKGTVQRLPSLELYKEQIDKLYRDVGDGVGGNEQPYSLHVEGDGLIIPK